MPNFILVVDDDPAQRRILEETVKRAGHKTKTAKNGHDAIQILQSPEGKDISAMLLDLVMPEMTGEEVLEQMRALEHRPPVIVQTSNGSVDTAIKAMRAGAVDFVIKPVNPERLKVSIKNALKYQSLQGEIKRIRRKSNGTLTFDNLITNAPGMSRVINLGKRAASSNIPVLIEGESGVGKEVIARAIQGESERSGKPFVTVNCGAIPENLIESILFGHEKGAFTGATEKRNGKFFEANGGTLFLDEVGELPLDAQVKLLRALQEGEIDPVGSKKSIKVDFRLISATNRDMINQVKEGKFREDLYYRLNVFPIYVPPLSERKEDIPALTDLFITRFANEENKSITGISTNALELLQAYNWPGNVRQLENTLFRAVVLADNAELTMDEFPQIAAHVHGEKLAVPAAPAPKVKAIPAFEGPAMIGSDIPIPQVVSQNDERKDALGIRVVTDTGNLRTLEEVEADMIKLAFGRYRGHMTEIAKHLGIGRSTLYRKMRDFGIEPNAS